MSQGLWPQDFWLQRSVSSGEFRALFSSEFPEGQIKNELVIPDYPNVYLISLLVPMEDKVRLDSFLKAFCEVRGFELDYLPHNGEPEPAVYPPEHPLQRIFGNQTQSVQTACQALAPKFGTTAEGVWERVLLLKRACGKTTEQAIDTLFSLQNPISAYEVH